MGGSSQSFCYGPTLRVLSQQFMELFGKAIYLRNSQGATMGACKGHILCFQIVTPCLRVSVTSLPIKEYDESHDL